MAMASTDTELEEQLLEAGNKLLLDPLSSVEDLLPLLDQVESCLSRVEQSPNDSMRNALSPSLKALITDKLLRHSDDDVKIAVASCVSEITRITAPEAPYDDDQMKVVFQLIVSSFENLHDKLSQSYAKRTSILETVAKVRSCVVMLDLECDALILEMFQHFFKAIREHHPENVFSSMETIMTLVLEESEDISLDLLSPLLASIKKDNEEVFPIVQKLGERVIECCATKLKPYLVQAVKSLAISVDDYSAVLASICQDTSDDLEKNDTCVTSELVEDKSDSAKQSPEESTHVVEKDSREVAPSQPENTGVSISPKLVMSNGVACVGEDNALADSKSIKKQEDADFSNHSEGLNISGEEVHNNLDTEKVDNSKQKPKQATKRRRKKSSSSTKSAKPSKGHVAANERETEKMLDHESNNKKVPSPPHEDHSVEAAGPPENDNEIDAKISSPKACNGESEVVASPPRESLYDENLSRKHGRTKKKDGPIKEGAAEDASKVSGGASDSDAKPVRQSVKKALGLKSDVKKASVVDSVKKGSGAVNDADAKKHSAKKLDENKKGSGGSSSRQMEDKKKGRRGKANSETDVAKSSAMELDKEMVSSPRSGTKSTKNENSEDTPKTNVKRKRSSGKENESSTKEYGQNLVGLQVKVWWPDDHEFYKGVIVSFDSAKKKHKVLYDDGDEETLNLVKEKWKVIEADSDADKEERSDHTDLDASTDMPPKKKGKRSAGESTKQGKMDASSRSGGAATSSRSKGASTKSSQKSEDGNKSIDSKTISKPEDEVGRKSKASAPKSGSNKSIVTDKKMSNKSKNIDTSKTSESKDDDTSTPKPSAKSKQETPKSGKSKQETLKTLISKRKPFKSGGKTDVNGAGKVKFGLLKRKYSENENSDV
ncbi:hypothetical protein AAZX31_06G059500 [Glycine max]|uniref:Tudor domain-containing protein n=1 Tax=Glycine max TaxID=3847 RepID=K7KTE7_SOYBN|nr:nucleolar and coiled-body phosphoprotein 1 isoform X1 [Glycine max]XP_028235178.1 nucleolar and coiled-body phosphoprotein 1-like isoform X2 [Glycine soja]KAG5045137.1 hypothetical protein JHK86_014543 [Glycine max]KAG5147637.1 hypothetical protein JHK82_014518 [Glycine max]KRH52344.1 hypothetical protein GLYMA_06G062700v4 [Glycine max]|eukprot:XP_014632786.1 nucleolar and coiled-body phosphoprotein 1 isoform X2 [Glycine max]